MTQNTTQRLIRFFDETLNTCSADSPHIVGWSTRQTQHIRFAKLNEIGCLEHSSLLDVGCGVGDYWAYLHASDPTVKYTGIDLNPRMILLAKKKYPEGVFLHDSLEKVEQKYDYLMSSGAFNLALEDNPAYLKEMIRKMVRAARKGVAFNALSQYAPYRMRYRDLYYYNPAEVFDFCRQNWECVNLRHDYLSNDFTIHIKLEKE